MSRPRANHIQRYRQLWNAVSPFLGTSTQRIIAISGLSVLRGLAEAGVLVIVAQVALALSEGEASISYSTGPLGEQQLETLVALVVAGLLAAVMFGLHLAIAVLTSEMSAQALATARTRLAHAFLTAAWDIQAGEREGHLQEVLTTYANRVQGAASLIAGSLKAFFNLIALVAVAIAVSPVAACGLVVAVTGLSIALRPINRITRRRAIKNRDANSAFATKMTEIVAVAQEVTIFDVGPAVSAQIDNTIQEASRTTRSVSLMKQMVPAIYQSLAILLVLAGLGSLSASGITDIAALGAVVLILLRSVSYGQQLQVATNSLNEAVPYLRMIRSEEARFLRRSPTREGANIGAVDRLEMQDVSYQYTADAVALSGISLAISRGEVVGLVGPSGSGKSTLIQILLRLRIPTSGHFLINGRGSDVYSLTDWYKLLAVVPQSSRLVEGTVEDNIRFFRPSLTTEDVHIAARRAHIHDEIVTWPAGYDTVLRGMGGGVSGGQAQRLCIARALAGNPQLLVLDEPTSALDVHSEAKIQETLAGLKGEVTLVIIAHRLSTLRMCERIVVLGAGKLLAFDTPAMLESGNSYYREALDLSRGN